MPGDATPARLEVGRIGRAHGLRGEVAVTLSTDRAERVAVGSRLHVDERVLTVVAARPHQGRWLVRFEEVGDRTAAEALRLTASEWQIENVLKKVVSDKLIGTLSYSDPETGSHFWYPISSGARKVDGGYEVLKKASWTTSGGFADWYVLQTTSPDFKES